MTPAQYTTLAAAIRANTTSSVIAAVAARDDGFITNFFNGPSTTKAWRNDVSREDLFGALNLVGYDALTAGKRDGFRLLFDIAPVSFFTGKVRSAIVDWFPTVDATAILTMATRFATLGEMVFDGTSATSGTVTATKLNFYGTITQPDVSAALNWY